MVYLGGRSTFSINGFGEAARAYFGKDIHNLTLTEAATLAGLIQRPSYYNPFRYPDRALDRRNTVLLLMRDNKYISASQYQAAIAAPLDLRPGKTESDESQYFLDVASDETFKKLEDQYPHGSARVNTTIDLRLERAAEQAITDGMQLVDKQLASRRKSAKNRTRAAASGAHRDRSAYRRSEGAVRRPGLCGQPTRSRVCETPTRFGFQAFRLYGGAEYRGLWRK